MAFQEIVNQCGRVKRDPALNLGWSDVGASHRVNCDTPPLKGLRLEPFGSIRNHCEESMRCALSRFHPEPEIFE